MGALSRVALGRAIQKKRYDNIGKAMFQTPPTPQATLGFNYWNIALLVSPPLFRIAPEFDLNEYPLVNLKNINYERFLQKARRFSFHPSPSGDERCPFLAIFFHLLLLLSAQRN